jgi:HEPN domain-containing protein
MNYLPKESCSSDEKILLQLLLKIAPVEKIYILGKSICQQLIESIFLPGPASGNGTTHYYLLVIVPKNVGYSDYDLQDRIENKCRGYIAVTVIILRVEQFTNWLNEEHPFAHRIVRQAVLLYGINDVEPAANEHFPAADYKKENRSYWTAEYNSVSEFIKGAELYMQRQQNRIAVFMLQQAAIQALRAIFKQGTGLQLHNYNLDKLLRYCALVVYEIPGMFTRNNEREERLFQLLRRATIEATHDQDFTATKDDVAIIFERIKRLQQIMAAR